MTSRPWIPMLSRSSLAVVTTISLAVVSAISMVACGSRGPTDAERLAQGRELVQKMSARLAAATDISATTTEVRDMVRASGAKASVTLTAEYTMRRPDRFYVKSTGARSLEVWYNGKIVTVASHQHKVFGQAPMPETVDRTFDALAERYDLPLPLADLFYSAPEKALLSEKTTGGYAGTENRGRHGLPPSEVSGRGRALGAVAADARRIAAKAVQGGTGKAHGRAGHRRDLHSMEPRGTHRSGQVHAECPQGLRGYRHSATGRGSQEIGGCGVPRSRGSGPEVAPARTPDAGTGTNTWMPARRPRIMNSFDNTAKLIATCLVAAVVTSIGLAPTLAQVRSARRGAVAKGENATAAAGPAASR